MKYTEADVQRFLRLVKAVSGEAVKNCASEFQEGYTQIYITCSVDSAIPAEILIALRESIRAALEPLAHEAPIPTLVVSLSSDDGRVFEGIAM